MTEKTTIMEPEEGVMMIPINPNAPIIFPTTEEQLVQLETKLAIDKMPTDLAVKENHELVRVSIAECRTVRGSVEKKRKEMVSPLVEYQRNVNQAAKEISSRIAAVEDPLKERKKDHDDRIEIERREAARKEEERVDAINLGMAEMNTILATSISSDSSVVSDEIEKLEKDTLEWADEFFEKADAIRSNVIVQLKDVREMKEANEKMQREQQEREIIDARAKEEEELLRIQEKEAAETKARMAKLKADREAQQRQVLIDEQAAEIAKQQAELKEGQDALAAEKLAREQEEEARIKAQEESDARIKKEAEETELKIQQEAREVERKAQEEKRKQDEEVEAKRLAEEDERLRAQRIANTCAALATILDDFEDDEYCMSIAKHVVSAIIAGHFDHIKWVD